MRLPNQHNNPEHTDRRASINPNSACVHSLCDTPNAELDMITRWIKLSDEALLTSKHARVKAANYLRRTFERREGWRSLGDASPSVG
jgi:hypothetical protein